MVYGYSRVTTHSELTTLKRTMKVDELVVDVVANLNRTESPNLNILLNKVQDGDVLEIDSLETAFGDSYAFEQVFNKITSSGLTLKITQDSLVITKKDLEEAGSINNLMGVTLAFIRFINVLKARLTSATRHNKMSFPPNFLEVYKDYTDETISLRQAAKKLFVSHTTFANMAKEFDR